MTKRVTKKTDILKNKKFTKRDRLYVGLDVHKKQHHVGFWLNGRIVKTLGIGTDSVLVKGTVGVRSLHKIVAGIQIKTGRCLQTQIKKGPVGFIIIIRKISITRNIHIITHEKIIAGAAFIFIPQLNSSHSALLIMNIILLLVLTQHLIQVINYE